MKRSHDAFYLNEDNTVIKDSFIAVADQIPRHFRGKIADVGCATGAFPAYLSKRFPDSTIHGVEYLPALVDRARRDFPTIEFFEGNVMDQHSVTQRYDVITMLGVLVIFDDVEMVLKNVLSWLAPGGKLILHNMINDQDIDVFVKYKASEDGFSIENHESGWNIVSKASLARISSENGAQLVSCSPFELTVDIQPNPGDPMRSWTEKDADGQRKIFNALHIRQPQQVAVIKKYQIPL